MKDAKSGTRLKNTIKRQAGAIKIYAHSHFFLSRISAFTAMAPILPPECMEKLTPAKSRRPETGGRGRLFKEVRP
jgi:hypothetical protein